MALVRYECLSGSTFPRVRLRCDLELIFLFLFFFCSLLHWKLPVFHSVLLQPIFSFLFYCQISHRCLTLTGRREGSSTATSSLTSTHLFADCKRSKHTQQEIKRKPSKRLSLWAKYLVSNKANMLKHTSAGNAFLCFSGKTQKHLIRPFRHSVHPPASMLTQQLVVELIHF